jgi:hypothetical protein
VLGVLPGIPGSIQAVEVIKLILGIGDTLSGRLPAYDSLEQSFRTYKMLRDPQCPACSIDPADIVIAEYDELCLPHPQPRLRSERRAQAGTAGDILVGPRHRAAPHGLDDMAVAACPSTTARSAFCRTGSST